MSRLLYVQKYFDSIVPERQNEDLPETNLYKRWEQTKQEALKYFDEYQFSQGLERASEFIRAINKYADERLPGSWQNLRKKQTKETYKPAFPPW